MGGAHVVVCGDVLLPADVEEAKALLIERLGVSSYAAIVLLHAVGHPEVKSTLDRLRRMIGEEEFRKMFQRGFEELEKVAGPGLIVYAEACRLVKEVGVSRLAALDVRILIESVTVKRVKSGEVADVNAVVEVAASGESAAAFGLTKLAIRARFEKIVESASEGDLTLGRVYAPPNIPDNVRQFLVNTFLRDAEAIVETGLGATIVKVRDVLEDVFQRGRLVNLLEAIVIKVASELLSALVAPHAYVVKRIWVTSSTLLSVPRGAPEHVRKASEELAQINLAELVVDALRRTSKDVCILVEGSIEDRVDELRNVKRQYEVVDPGAYVLFVSGTVMTVPIRMLLRALPKGVRRIVGEDVKTLTQRLPAKVINVGRAAYVVVDLAPIGVSDAAQLCHRVAELRRGAQGADVVDAITRAVAEASDRGSNPGNGGE